MSNSALGTAVRADTQESEASDNDFVNIPLIGGIVGGFLALLLVVGLVVFVLARRERRKRTTETQASNQAEVESTPIFSPNYGKIVVQSEGNGNYDQAYFAHVPPPQDDSAYENCDITNFKSSA